MVLEVELEDELEDDECVEDVELELDVDEMEEDETVTVGEGAVPEASP